MSTGRAGACSIRGRRTSPRRCVPSVRCRGTVRTGRNGIAVSGAQLCFPVGCQPAGCCCVKIWPVLHARHSATARQSTLGLPVPPYTSSDENPRWEWRLLPTRPTSFQTGLASPTASYRIRPSPKSTGRPHTESRGPTGSERNLSVTMLDRGPT